MLWRIHQCLLSHQPYKLLFGALPSIQKAEKRWALFQILLSFVFLFVAVAVGILTIDTSTVTGGIMVAAIMLFGFGLLALVYAFGIGMYWFKPKHPIDNDEEAKRAKRDDRLHEDIQALIKEMRQDRNERRESRK